ncbi:carbon-nitrogen hydrolase family protein [Candidatus Parcubacteria bacterium]|nr:MAG: carbon-nitrogen hydrolase family protein [Candidatus Parcubacteria bacterium]
MSIKIALIQFWVEIDKEFLHTSKRADRMIALAKEKGCDVVVFPEDFWFGPLDYYKEKEIRKIVERETPEIINWLCEKAETHKINIIAGSFVEKIGREYFNICSVITDKGEIVYKYRKQRLVPYGFEREKLIPGKYLPLSFELCGIKMGVIICRDLFYPEFIKVLRKKGAEIVFVPSFWSKRSDDYLDHNLDYSKYKIVSEMKVVDALCEARSFESEMAICFVNASGRLTKGNKFDVLLGRTQICLPFFGQIKKINKNREGLIIYEHDRNVIQDARRVYQI